MTTKWQKLPALEGHENGCLHCPPILAKADLEKGIAVGFGAAYLTLDDKIILDGERAFQKGEAVPTFADAEKLALADPDHDWQIVLHGPLHGETYQRQGEGEWILVESNEGFA